MGTPSKSSCKTAAVMNLLGKGSSPHQDMQVLPNQPRDIETITREILDAKRTGGEAILTIGRGLLEAKAQLSHGEWLPWLTEKEEFSEKAAQNFMRIARNYSNPQALADLGATKALMLLALPREDRDEFISEPHVVNGEEKSVIDMTSRELDAVIKERDAALKAAAQAEADRRTADEAREKLSKEMALANEHIAGLSAEAAEHSAKVKEAQDTAARLEKELEELRSQPVDVAVQVDEAAVEAARKEVEERMRAELEKVRKDQAREEKARKAAEAAKTAAEQKLEQAEAEAQAIRDQAAKAEKKAALNADPDMVLLNEMYEQAQILVKRMGGVRLKKQDKEPENAKGIQDSLMALLPIVKEAAGR